MSDGMQVFTPGPCCDYPNQYEADNGETIYLNMCDCICHAASEEQS